jgi:uncharacterized protein YdeI (YjbR/CyaY-like superfamily)
MLKFPRPEPVPEIAALLSAYIAEAVELERTGRKPPVRPPAEAAELPAELAAVFLARPEVRAAFEALTPGRRRGYLLFFSAAKQSATRAARIEKNIPRILDGQGLHD